MTPWLLLTCVTMVLQVIGFFVCLYTIMEFSLFHAAMLRLNIIVVQVNVIYAHSTALLLGTEAYLLVLVYSLR